MIRRGALSLILFVASWLSGAAHLSDTPPAGSMTQPPARAALVFGSHGNVAYIMIMYEDGFSENLYPDEMVSTPVFPTATPQPPPQASLTPPPTNTPHAPASFTPAPTFAPEATPTQEVIAPTWTPAPTLMFPKDCTARVTTQSLHVRDAPSLTGHHIGWLYNGIGVHVEAILTGWLQIHFAAGTGYISADYVVLEGACN
jgi:uncharacterized protein YgiM (DUF1202 family)